MSEREIDAPRGRLAALCEAPALREVVTFPPMRLRAEGSGADDPAGDPDAG